MSESIITHYYGLKSSTYYKILVSNLDISLVNPNLEAVVRLPMDNPRLVHSLKVKNYDIYKNVLYLKKKNNVLKFYKRHVKYAIFWC